MVAATPAMKYGSKLNTALFILLLATIAIAWYMQRDIAALRPLVAELEWDEVTDLRVGLRGRPPLHFELGPGGWQMTEPLRIDVDARRLEEVINALNVPSQQQYTTRDADPAQLGLDEPPVARVVVDGAEYLVGEVSPVTGWRYLQRGEVVHMVYDVLYFRLLGDPQSWARRQPLPSGAQIARIEVDGEVLDGDVQEHVASAWTNAQAYQVRRYAGDGAFDRHARVWLNGAAAPIEYGLLLTDTGLTVVRIDVEVEYHLPAYGAESFWHVPEVE